MVFVFNTGTWQVKDASDLPLPYGRKQPFPLCMFDSMNRMDENGW